MARPLPAELLNLAAGLVTTAAIFSAAAWAYPPGRATIAWVGWVTMLAVVAMSAPRLARAWRERQQGDRCA